MPKKFLTDINLSQNELMNAVMHLLSTAPQNPVMGQLYYNTTNKMMYQYDGTEWKPVGNVYTNGNGITISATNVESADFASSSEATAGTSTTKVMSPSLVKAVIQTLDVAGFAMATVSSSGDGITIKGLKEVDGKVAADANNNLTIKIDATHGYDPQSNPLATVGSVAAAVQAGAVTVEAGNESATNLVSYTVKQGGTTVGTINIPKFLVVKSGSIVTGTWNGTTFTEDDPQAEETGAGKALRLVLNDSGDADSTDDVLYIDVADLCDVYSAGNGIAIAENNSISVVLKSYTKSTLASADPGSTANRQYPVMLDADGNLSVNVPWTDTTYTNVKLGQGYATCSTAAATAAKAAALTSYSLVTGGVVAVKFTYAVPASATLNVNSKGAKSIYYKGAAITANIIQAGDTATFMYDGTRYQLLAVDRVNKTAVTGVAWTDGDHHVVVTFADGTTQNITIHPTETAFTGNPTADQTPVFGGKFSVSQPVTDDYGHVTELNTREVTIPNSVATQSAAGLMSAEDKTKLDNMSAAHLAQYAITNPALTLNTSTGTCVWTIAKASLGNGNPQQAICSLRDNAGVEMVADVQYTSSAVVITINAAASIAAGAYVANILIPNAA